MHADEIVKWFNKPRQSALRPEQVMELYFTFHPRTAFLKNLPHEASLLDLGAGDGSLSVFKGWPQPSRQDLSMYAYSIEKGERFDDFAAYEISDWNVAPPTFGGRRFDAIISAHFIEHVDDPRSVAPWAASVLGDGGRIFIEWPSEDATELPERNELVGRGVDLLISNYRDDNTHQRLPKREIVLSSLRLSGFVIEQQGIVRLPWLEDEMMAHFSKSADPFPRQAAFWSWTGWSQFIIASYKPSNDVTS